jgi:hypothetical protein
VKCDKRTIPNCTVFQPDHKKTYIGSDLSRAVEARLQESTNKFHTSRYTVLLPSMCLFHHDTHFGLDQIMMFSASTREHTFATSLFF